MDGRPRAPGRQRDRPPAPSCRPPGPGAACARALVSNSILFVVGAGPRLGPVAAAAPVAVAVVGTPLTRGSVINCYIFINQTRWRALERNRISVRGSSCWCADVQSAVCVPWPAPCRPTAAKGRCWRARAHDRAGAVWLRARQARRPIIIHWIRWLAGATELAAANGPICE